MKTLLAIVPIVSLSILVVAADDGKEPSAPSELKNARFKYEVKRSELLRKLNLDYIKHLSQLQEVYTKRGDLDGALAFKEEIANIRSAESALSLLEAMSGKWRFNTGAGAEFDSKGRSPSGHRVLWVIDAKERKLYYRGSQKWHYDIVLSEDATAFTATTIQSGKKYTGKKLDK